MTRQVKFGSFTLDTSNGITVARWDEKEVRKDLYQGARRQGDRGIYLRSEEQGRQVNLEGVIKGSSESDLRSKVDSFLAALHTGEDWLQLYSDRKLLAKLYGPVSLVVGPPSDSYARRWRASFRSRDPYWCAASETVQTFTLSGSSPQTQLLTASAGVAPTWFHYFGITENGSGFNNKDLVITNASTGAQLQIIGLTMSAGQLAVLNFWDGELTDGSTTAIQPTAVIGEWWELPGGSASTLEVAFTGSSMNFSFTLKWYDRFFSA